MTTTPEQQPSPARRRKINWRTPLLALAAAGTLVWAAISQFGLSVDEALEWLLMSVVLAGSVMLAAAVAILFWKLPGWLLLKRREKKGSEQKGSDP